MSEVIPLSSSAARRSWKIPVLFQDEYLLALDKPSGLLTSPDRYDRQRPNLMKLLHAGIAEGRPWAKEHGLDYLMNAHRLDFETSGVILLAKSKTVLVELASFFGSEKPVKTYVALVERAPPEDQFEVDVKLGPHPAKAGLMRVDLKAGKRSRTLFQLLERFSGYALVQCSPLTGRTHQIRVHLRHVGLPVVADAWYGGKPLFLSRLKRDYRPKKTQPERPLIGRVALHAERLRLPHPVTGQPLAIAAPWPKDLAVAVKYLRRFGT